MYKEEALMIVQCNKLPAPTAERFFCECYGSEMYKEEALMIVQCNKQPAPTAER